MLYRGQQVNLFYAKSNWGAMQFYLTGPKNYCIGYRMKARSDDMLLNQYGLFDKSGKRLAGETEESIYAVFSKKYKDPWLRGSK
jgi:DNA polymerase/3'-5' exonuclease PolX